MSPNPHSTVAMPHAAPHDAAPQSAGENVIASHHLLGEASTMIIEHMGMRYTLRATRNGKLILTK